MCGLGQVGAQDKRTPKCRVQCIQAGAAIFNGQAFNARVPTGPEGAGDGQHGLSSLVLSSLQLPGGALLLICTEAL